MVDIFLFLFSGWIAEFYKSQKYEAKNVALKHVWSLVGDQNQCSTTTNHFQLYFDT